MPVWQQQQQQGQSVGVGGGGSGATSGHQSPELSSVGVVGVGGVAGSSGSATAGGGGGGRVLVSLANPHPLGPPAANVPTLGGLRELRVKR